MTEIRTRRISREKAKYKKKKRQLTLSFKLSRLSYFAKLSISYDASSDRQANLNNSSGTRNFLWLLLEQHPLRHRMSKVTKETSGANKIMRNAIDLTSITFRWTSSSSRQSVFFTTLNGSQRSPTTMIYDISDLPNMVGR